MGQWTRVLDGYHLDHCLDCGGVWLDHVVLEKLLREKSQQKTVQAYLGRSTGEQPVLENHPVQYLQCPHCSESMHRRNFGGISGIIVDECSKHGIWFDRDELAVVIAFTRDTTREVAVRQDPVVKTSGLREEDFTPRSAEQIIGEGLVSVVGELLDKLWGR